MNKTIEKDVGRLYELVQTEDGTFYLFVVVGGIAMYETKMKLTLEEASQYHNEGKAFLDDLAYRVCKNYLGEFKERLE